MLITSGTFLGPGGRLDKALMGTGMAFVHIRRGMPRGRRWTMDVFIDMLDETFRMSGRY